MRKPRSNDLGKVKIVLDLIRGKDTNTAMAILKNTNKIASEHLIKLLKSAVANAEHNFNMGPAGINVTKNSGDKPWPASNASSGIYIPL